MAIQFAQTVDLTTNRLINVGTASAATDAVSKGYVDTLVGSAISGLAWVEPVRAGSTGNVDPAAPGAIDGVTLATGDRVLLKSQTDPVENGVYSYDGTVLTRTGDDLDAGSVVTVGEGTVNADKVFLLTTDGPVTVGTTPLTFTLVNITPVVLTAGTAIDLTGDAIAVKYGSGLKIDGSGNLALDTAVLPTAVAKYAANVGDGSADTITVTHNLNTLDCTVALYETTSGNAVDVFAEVRRPSVNTVQLSFGTAPASGAYRVVVTG